MSKVVNIRDYRDGRRVVLPEGIIRIDRRSRWGNPFKIGPAVAHLNEEVTGMIVPYRITLTREDAIEAFRTYAKMRLAWNPEWFDPLRGLDLACWCAPEACHGDVILELLELYPPSFRSPDGCTCGPWFVEGDPKFRTTKGSWHKNACPLKDPVIAIEATI